jgi:type II secretory pathway component PulC
MRHIRVAARCWKKARRVACRKSWGLKVGDVVTAINGKLLSGPGDVAGLYDQLVKNERVSVDVLRSGEKMNFGIQVTP